MIIKGTEVEIKKAISAKTKKEYCIMTVKFPNGYVIRSFPTYDQQYILADYINGDNREGK